MLTSKYLLQAKFTPRISTNVSDVPARGALLGVLSTIFAGIHGAVERIQYAPCTSPIAPTAVPAATRVCVPGSPVKPVSLKGKYACSVTLSVTRPWLGFASSGVVYVLWIAISSMTPLKNWDVFAPATVAHMLRPPPIVGRDVVVNREITLSFFFRYPWPCAFTDSVM